MDIKFNDNLYDGRYHKASMRKTSEEALASLENSLSKVHVMASTLSDGETIESYYNGLPVMDDESKPVKPRSLEDILLAVGDTTNNFLIDNLNG